MSRLWAFWAVALCSPVGRQQYFQGNTLPPPSGFKLIGRTIGSVTKAECKEDNYSNFNPEDGGSMFLRNVDIHLQDYTVSIQETNL
jgi:hypothetical protein